MSLISVTTYDEASPESRPAFDQFIKLTGKMPNLYATIGHSAVTLNAYLAFVQAQAKGSFHAKEREGIYLIVSELNACEYCLASHTVSALKNGWTEEDTLLLRAGKHPDEKWKILYAVIGSVIGRKGEVDDELLLRFMHIGYRDPQAALMDLLALINLMSFTNYCYRLTRIPIDFPPAPGLTGIQR